MKNNRVYSTARPKPYISRKGSKTRRKPGAKSVMNKDEGDEKDERIKNPIVFIPSIPAKDFSLDVEIKDIVTFVYNSHRVYFFVYLLSHKLIESKAPAGRDRQQNTKTLTVIWVASKN